MKLATLKDGTRDGQLVVVSRDLHTAAIADAIAPTMQRVIEDWSFYAPQLRALYDALNTGRARRAFGFDPKHCMAPLPRAYRMVAHTEQAGAAERPVARSTRKTSKKSSVATVLSDMSAHMSPRRSDHLLSAHEDIVVNADHAALDFRAGLAVILSDVAPHIVPQGAAEHVRLVMLASTFADTVHTADGATVADASGRYDLSGFSPVAVTPDELGDVWQNGRFERMLDVQVNGRRAPRAMLDDAASVDFSLLVAGLAHDRGITAGTVLFSVPASHLTKAAQRGQASLLDVASDVATDDEIPDKEAASTSTKATQGLGFGDRIRIDLLSTSGESICGVIEQSIAASDETED